MIFIATSKTRTSLMFEHVEKTVEVATSLRLHFFIASRQEVRSRKTKLRKRKTMNTIALVLYMCLKSTAGAQQEEQVPPPAMLGKASFYGGGKDGIEPLDSLHLRGVGEDFWHAQPSSKPKARTGELQIEDGSPNENIAAMLAADLAYETTERHFRQQKAPAAEPPKAAALQHWFTGAVNKYRSAAPKPAPEKRPLVSCHHFLVAAGVLGFLGIVLICMDDRRTNAQIIEVSLARRGSNSEGQRFITDYGSGSDTEDSAKELIIHGAGGEILEDDTSTKQSLYARRLGERQTLKIQSIV